MEIPLGRYITLISGQNGTGKSTILGMLGQPFGLRGEKDVFGHEMRAKFTDIFKLSPEHDIPGDHLYFVNLNDSSLYTGGSHVQVKSYERSGYDKLPIRLVTGAKRGKGDGNIDYPVIYLGLRRTYPVGEIPNVAQTSSNLTAEEITRFSNWYSSVFLSWSQGSLTPVELDRNAAKKSTILVNSDSYDYLANSAGQDNLGQILAALISFARLKERLSDNYRGGLLLIDELDVTLFPASQDQLLDILLSVAKDLMIQVVFTTHSISLIGHALSVKKSKDDIEVIYLRRRDSGIERLDKPSMEDIMADLNVRTIARPAQPRAEIWCEDDEAAWFLRMILPSPIKRKCTIVSAGLSCGELGELSTKPIESLKDVTFVVDGDSLRSASNKIKNSDSLLFLPTNGKNPETAVYSFLCSLPDDGDFWRKMEEEFRYSKQILERSYHTAVDSSDSSLRRLQKKWFKKEKASGCWGANGQTVMAQWIKDNRDSLATFTGDLEKRVDRIIRRKAALSKTEQIESM